MNSALGNIRHALDKVSDGMNGLPNANNKKMIENVCGD